MSILPVAGEDTDDENGDVDERDEVTQGQCGPVAPHLGKLGLFFTNWAFLRYLM